MVPDSPLIAKAKEKATAAHEGQMRDWGGGPYIQHPARVAAIIAALPGANEAMVAAAWLHDVVEDTDVPLAEIDRDFGDAVANLVMWMTNPEKLRTENRLTYKLRTFARLAEAPLQARQIKMCDRLDNVRDTPAEPAAARSFGKTYARESRMLFESICFGTPPELCGMLIKEIIALEERIKKAEEPS